LKECLQYSVKYGYTTQEKADKILAQSKKGGPGGCRGPEECDAFCKQPENTRACMKFAVDEGKITQEEAELVTAQMEKNRVEGKKPIEENESDEPRQRQTKAQEILQKKTGPGGCKNRQECAAFCDKEENHETCVTFSKENGLLNEEEIKMAEKQMSLLQKLEKQGGGPGGCKTRQECDAFCKDQNNVETCIQFAAKQGMLSPEKMGQMMGQTIEAKQRIEGVGQYQMMMNGTISSEKKILPPRENTANNRLPIPISGQVCPNGNCEQNMNESSSTSNEQRERLQQRINELRPAQIGCDGENCEQAVNEMSPSQGEASPYEQPQQVLPQQIKTQYRQPPQGIQYPMPPEGFSGGGGTPQPTGTGGNIPPPPAPPAPLPVSVAFQNLLASVTAFFLGK
jgi:hypothetical protein